MRVLVFENEIEKVIKTFEFTNKLYFDDSLTFEWVTKSQDFGDFNRVSEYDLVIVDIDLSIRSNLDGYGILNILIDEIGFDKIFVMTGHEVAKELENKGYVGIDVLRKPVMLDELAHLLKNFKNS